MHNYHDLLMAKAAALPETLRPILQLAETTNPDAVIVCDRDARPLGYALERLAEVQGTEFKLHDKIWYRRISKKLGRDAIADHCEQIFAELRERPAPKILVVDDHISRQGTTASLFRAATASAGLGHAKIAWTTLTGRGTAMNLMPYASPAVEVPWRDRADILGIDYDGTELIEMPTDASCEFYAAIDEAAQKAAA